MPLTYSLITATLMYSNEDTHLTGFKLIYYIFKYLHRQVCIFFNASHSCKQFAVCSSMVKLINYTGKEVYSPEDFDVITTSKIVNIHAIRTLRNQLSCCVVLIAISNSGRISINLLSCIDLVVRDTSVMSMAVTQSRLN